MVFTKVFVGNVFKVELITIKTKKSKVSGLNSILCSAYVDVHHGDYTGRTSRTVSDSVSYRVDVTRTFNLFLHQSLVDVPFLQRPNSSGQV